MLHQFLWWRGRSQSVWNLVFRGVKVKKRLRLMFKFPVILEMSDEVQTDRWPPQIYCVISTVDTFDYYERLWVYFSVKSLLNIGSCWFFGGLLRFDFIVFLFDCGPFKDISDLLFQQIVKLLNMFLYLVPESPWQVRMVFVLDPPPVVSCVILFWSPGTKTIIHTMIQRNAFLDSGWYLCVCAKCNDLFFFSSRPEKLLVSGLFPLVRLLVSLVRSGNTVQTAAAAASIKTRPGCF